MKTNQSLVINLYNVKGLKKLFALVLVLSLINLIIGCNYYMVDEIHWKHKELTKENLLYYQKHNKYFIVDMGNQSFHITDLEINTETMVINCCIDSVDIKH